jgi:hypothetical protein
MLVSAQSISTLTFSLVIMLLFLFLNETWLDPHREGGNDEWALKLLHETIRERHCSVAMQ